MTKCPKCKNELIVHKSINVDLSGLTPSEIKQLRKSEVTYYYCDECIGYFLFLHSKVYRYNGFAWERFGIEPIKVIFT